MLLDSAFTTMLFTSVTYTNLPSRLPTQYSTLYSNNLSKLLLSMQGTKDLYFLDIADVVRGSIVLNEGVTTWPPNSPISIAAAALLKRGAVAELDAAKKEVDPFTDGMKQALTYTGGLDTLSAPGIGSPNAVFMNTCLQHFLWTVSSVIILCGVLSQLFTLPLCLSITLFPVSLLLEACC